MRGPLAPVRENIGADFAPLRPTVLIVWVAVVATAFGERHLGFGMSGVDFAHHDRMPDVTVQTTQLAHRQKPGSSSWRLLAPVEEFRRLTAATTISRPHAGSLNTVSDVRVLPDVS